MGGPTGTIVLAAISAPTDFGVVFLTLYKITNLKEVMSLQVDNLDS